MDKDTLLKADMRRDDHRRDQRETTTYHLLTPSSTGVPSQLDRIALEDEVGRNLIPTMVCPGSSENTTVVERPDMVLGCILMSVYRCQQKSVTENTIVFIVRDLLKENAPERMGSIIHL